MEEVESCINYLAVCLELKVCKVNLTCSCYLPVLSHVVILNDAQLHFHSQTSEFNLSKVKHLEVGELETTNRLTFKVGIFNFKNDRVGFAIFRWNCSDRSFIDLKLLYFD